jgi:hypothetical protein
VGRIRRGRAGLGARTARRLHDPRHLRVAIDAPRHADADALRFTRPCNPAAEKSRSAVAGLCATARRRTADNACRRLGRHALHVTAARSAASG